MTNSKDLLRTGRRLSKPTKLPGMPKAPKTENKELNTFLTQLSEIVSIRLGHRGDPLDRNLTVRELQRLGLLDRMATAQFNPAKPHSDLLLAKAAFEDMQQRIISMATDVQSILNRVIQVETEVRTRLSTLETKHDGDITTLQGSINDINAKLDAAKKLAEKTTTQLEGMMMFIESFDSQLEAMEIYHAKVDAFIEWTKNKFTWVESEIQYLTGKQTWNESEFTWVKKYINDIENTIPAPIPPSGGTVPGANEPPPPVVQPPPPVVPPPDTTPPPTPESSGELTTGGMSMAGVQGTWSYPNPVYNPATGEYQTGGMVWIGKRAATQAEINSMLNTGASVDMRSVCGTDDPNYTTFWLQHGSSRGPQLPIGTTTTTTSGGTKTTTTTQPQSSSFNGTAAELEALLKAWG